MAGSVLEIAPLGFPWLTLDPLLSGSHHSDACPAGSERLGAAASLSERDLGQDFAGKAREAGGLARHADGNFEPAERA
jgi:hypothetical protein